jgi:hypothetical protein
VLGIKKISQRKSGYICCVSCYTTIEINDIIHTFGPQDRLIMGKNCLHYTFQSTWRCICTTYCMKKIIGLLSLIVAVFLTACSNDKTEVKKETIIAPAPGTVTPQKNTTIVVDKNGVKVGTKKVDVTINPEKKK